MNPLESLRVICFLIITLSHFSSTHFGVDDVLDRSFTFSGDVLRASHFMAKRQIQNAAPNPPPSPPIDLDSYYNGCGKSKGCVPEKCSRNRNCDYLISWSYSSVAAYEYIRYTITADNLMSSTGASCTSADRPYLAIAFSLDNTLNNVLVVHCGLREKAPGTRSLAFETLIETIGESKAENRVGDDDNSTNQIENSGDSTLDNVNATTSNETNGLSPSGNRTKRELENDSAGLEDISVGHSGTDHKTSNEGGGDEMMTHDDDLAEMTNNKGDNMSHDDFMDRRGGMISKLKKKKPKEEQDHKKKKGKKHKKKKKSHHHDHAKGKHTDNSIGSRSRQGSPVSGATSPSNNSVHLGWSSMSEYELYGNGCNTTTVKGKIRHCDFKMDENNNAVCTFELQERVFLRQEIYNLLENKHFIHIVSGCNVSDLQDSFSSGSHKFQTKEAIHFRSYKQNFAGGYETDFAKWHATLMIVTWCILVPNGVFFARYFKESFVHLSCFKYRMWFAGHFVLQIIGFILSLASIVIIVKDKLQVGFSWPTTPATSVHFKLALATLFFHSYQVFFGAVRCTGKKLRRVFAFIHFTSGLTCYIISMVLIAMSVKLGMPCSVKYFVIGMTCWKILCHIFMMIHFHRLDKKLGLKISRALYPFPLAPVTYDEIHGSGKRFQILILHFVGSLALAAGLTYTYWTTNPCYKKDEDD